MRALALSLSLALALALVRARALALARARSLARALVVGGLLWTAGCADPRSMGPQHERVVGSWMAELPGGRPPIQVTLPVHLDTLLPRTSGEYVLRTRVEVPEEMRGLSLTLAIAHMPALAALRVDGIEALPVDASALDRYRATSPNRWRIPENAAKDGHLDLEMRVYHRFARSAWIDSTAVLTTDPMGGHTLAAVHAFNTVTAIGALAAALVVAFLYGFIFVSLPDKRRAVYGWFALGAICGMPYPAFLLGITQPVLGVYEAPFMILALTLGSIAAMFFARAYVGVPPPSRVWFGVFAAVVGISVLARNPFISVLVVGPIAVGVTIANTIAQIAFIARLRRERGALPKSTYALAITWPAIVLLGLPDILAWLGQGEPTSGVRTASLGILGISLYQAAALTREHLVALERADDLNVELGRRVMLVQSKHQEVEQLNDELRRQIAARSRELAEKLANMDDDEHAPQRSLEVGSVVEGRYRVIKELGSGGMGTVYEVERVADGKHFALKALGAGGGSEARARFAREAQIVANVNHRNVVSIVDVDVAKSGFIFLVMELVASGSTLHDVRRRERNVPWTLGVLAQVAAGIDAIHGAGIIHRDLKPGNILFSRGLDGRKPLVKITDFGISSLVPDGTRISAMERIATVAQSQARPSPELDPFAVDGGDVTAREGGRARALLDLEYRPEERGDAPENAKTERMRTVFEGAGGGPRGSERPPGLAPGSNRGSDQPRTPAAGKRTPAAPLTETGLIFGTPQYMAQELTTGTKNATRASDVFSLGIIAFEVLTGKRPFPEAPVSAKLEGRPLPQAKLFRAACPLLPPEIALLLDRALEHDPQRRPSAKELAVALKEAADRLTT